MILIDNLKIPLLNYFILLSFLLVNKIYNYSILTIILLTLEINII